ncbi:MAG: secondary thiamine-phosphate synthase enzyme YjbQ [Verrucomicrobia bacterium]|nr:secondary thiamine-phosphate synthase enzyme YjbQ [Verrucomicrobiota bacterium]MDA1064875.1 secondary thiamine-phosphate synthase enzyme YjbQ [Verrucomicrobiota bacterium]
MAVFQSTISIQTRGKGTVEISDLLQDKIASSGYQVGIASVFCHHTSCSLVLMENADPSARRDLENYFERLVPENDPHYTHTYEGPDDMPSHIKMALTRSSENIPFSNGRSSLGTWQGMFLWEHRTAPHNRKLTVTIMGE